MTPERLASIVDCGVSIDFETHRIQPGLLIPPLVCGSTARVVDVGEGRRGIRGRLLTADEAVAAIIAVLEDPNAILVNLNVAFDLAVAVREAALRGRDIFPLVFGAYVEGRVFDPGIAEQLHAIAEGHLLGDPRTGGKLVDPHTGEQQVGYRLSVVTDLVLGRVDAKANDRWRESYALLAGIPQEQWPPEARQYPVDDVCNALEIALAQIGAVPNVGAHRWRPDMACARCGANRGQGGCPSSCTSVYPRRNLHDLARQCYAAWALHLGACWGFRTDREAVDALERACAAERAAGLPALIAAGFLRTDGTEDGAAVKRAVALAYGCSGTCPAADPLAGPQEPVCRDGKIWKTFSKRDGRPLGKGTNCPKCNGTGLDLATAPVPRTDPTEKFPDGQVQSGRDVLAESGDELLMEYAGAQEDDKILDTYVPALREGQDVPWVLRPNVLVETGRASYSGVVMLLPRRVSPRLSTLLAKDPRAPLGVRDCIVAREGRGFGSVDYKGGELVAFGQSCKNRVGFSRLGEALALGLDAHAALGATMVGEEYAAFVAKLKIKDKRGKDVRQASKCFHPDTEVLTRRGWVRVGDLRADDDVAAAIPGRDGVAVEWQRPTQLTRRPSPGALVHLYNEGMDLRVTEEHRMLVRRTNGAWDVVRPEDVNRARGWWNAGQYAGGDWDPPERELRLAVATQADGSFRHARISFGFKKQRKIDRMRALLAGEEYVESVTSQGATSFVCGRALSDQLHAYLDGEKRFTWRWLTLTPRAREVVLDEAVHWDGHRPKRCRAYKYFSTLPQNVDVLQALAAISNRKTRAVWNPHSTDLERGHAVCGDLTIRDKPNTRGENLRTQVIPYDGDVVCLSVPSSFVLVRDRGVVVVVGQCGNFGFPGGMGPVKLVLQQRRQGPDTAHPAGPSTVWDEHARAFVAGYKGLRFCVLLGKAERCGVHKVTSWKDRPCPPTCRACIEAATEIRATWFRQWPEAKPYLDWHSANVDTRGEVVQHYSNRIRGVDNFPSAANGDFQGLLADIAKRALCRVSYEQHVRTVVRALDPDRWPSKFEGGPSPLIGSQVIVFQHDEVFTEADLAVLPEVAERTVEIMREDFRLGCPDYAAACDAEEAIALRWWKEMSPVRDPVTGRLLLWEPRS